MDSRSSTQEEEMKKITLLIVTVAALLAFAGTAQAKEVASLKICGASGCKTTTDRDKLRNWEPNTNTNPESVNFTNPQAYYTVELGFADPEGNVIHHETAYWLADAGLMRFVSQTQDPWWKLWPNQTSLYRDVASGI